MEGIEPSRNHVVSRVFSTLVEEICNENGCDLQYSGLESMNALPLDCVPTIRDELQAAAARITQQMNKLIAHLMYRLNLESLVFRLPVDVLMMIFREFKPDLPHEHSSLFNPLLVCRTWYDIIIGSPQLWAVVNGRMPLNLARSLIHRTQPHPISVDWPHDAVYDGHSILNLFIGNSMRIRRMSVYASRWNVQERPILRRLLEAPTPALEVLEVKVEPVRLSSDGPSGATAVDTFVLSEGLPLKHLSLRDVTTPLESPRLFNLKTLALQGSAVPWSPQSLLRVLSSLQRLEALDIQVLRSSSGDVESTTSVILPHLKELRCRAHTSRLYSLLSTPLSAPTWR